MARRSSVDVGFLLIDGYDVMGVTTDLTDKVEAIVEEMLPYGEGWPDNLYTGVKKAELSQEGYFDDAADSINDALKDKSGDTRVLCYGLEGNEVGQQFIGYKGAVQVNYERVATRGQLHRANAKYNGSGQVDEGAIVHGHTARESDGDTKATPASVSAQTTAGGVAYLQLSALDLDGGNDLTIKILESTNEVDWDELLTFTAATAAPAAERVVIAGNVKKHLAVSWEFDGGTDPTAKFFVGFKRN